MRKNNQVKPVNERSSPEVHSCVETGGVLWAFKSNLNL